MTTKAAQDNNREVAITLDDEVVSCPSVNGLLMKVTRRSRVALQCKMPPIWQNILQVSYLPKLKLYRNH